MHLKKIVTAALLSGWSFEPVVAHQSTEIASRTAGNFHLGDLLPAGRIGVRLESRFFWSDSYFNAHGKHTQMADSLDEIVLDAYALPVLAAFGANATLGTTSAVSSVRGTAQRLTLGFGVTDDLSIGMQLPYARVAHDVSLALTPGNLVNNPSYNTAVPPGVTNPLFLPAQGPYAVLPRVRLEDVMNLLTSPAYGYGYRRVSSVTSSGIGDPVIGAAWRSYKSDRTALILTPSLRFGLSRDNDPDDLLDINYEDGTTDLSLDVTYLHVSDAWDIRAVSGYTFQSKDHVQARAATINEVIVPATRKERLERKVGNQWNISSELGWGIASVRLAMRLEYTQLGRTDYRSLRGQDVSGLEAGTGGHATHARAMVQWNGISAWRKGVLPLPLLASVEYRDTLEGRNWADTRAAYVVLTGVF